MSVAEMLNHSERRRSGAFSVGTQWRGDKTHKGTELAPGRHLWA